MQKRLWVMTSTTCLELLQAHKLIVFYCMFTVVTSKRISHFFGSDVGSSLDKLGHQRRKDTLSQSQDYKSLKRWEPCLRTSWPTDPGKQTSRACRAFALWKTVTWRKSGAMSRDQRLIGNPKQPYIIFGSDYSLLIYDESLGFLVEIYYATFYTAAGWPQLFVASSLGAEDVSGHEPTTHLGAWLHAFPGDGHDGSSW